jgi:hypothetical protein
MIVYTLLFTLLGKDPAENRYVEMFYIWLCYVYRNAALEAPDKVCILLDQPTIDYLNSNSIFGYILTNSKIPTEFRLIPQPSTLSQGITERYNLGVIGDFNEPAIFLDLDVLVMKPLAFIKDIAPDTLTVVGEGDIYNDNYGGQVLERIPGHELLPGLTGAIYAFQLGKRVTALFASVRSACLAKDPPFYTIDQPFFNKYAYESIYRNENFIDIMQAGRMENNKLNPSDSAIFVNYCGGPGEGTRHHQKMLVMLCIDFLTGCKRVTNAVSLTEQAGADQKHQAQPSEESPETPAEASAAPE